MKFLEKLDRQSPVLIGLAQAAGVMIYILALVLMVNLLEAAVQPDPPEFVAAAFFLLTFVFSALVCGSLILGYPALLVLKGEVKRAVAIVAWSGLTFAIVLVLALTLLVALN